VILSTQKHPEGQLGYIVHIEISGNVLSKCVC